MADADEKIEAMLRAGTTGAAAPADPPATKRNHRSRQPGRPAGLPGLARKTQPNRLSILLPLAEANTIRKLAGAYGYPRAEIVAWLIRRGFAALPAHIRSRPPDPPETEA